MAGISTKFRVMLLRVGECLTENDVQNLAFLCEGIKPARRELLRNARALFVELQGRDLLNEHNVSVLSGWLEELNLLDALRPLREYSEKNLQSTTELAERCIQHEDLVLKYFCVTCNSKVCPDCAFNLHDKSSHDVIKLSDINDEVSKRRIVLDGVIERMSKRTETLQEEWEKKKEFFSNCHEKIRKEIQKDTNLIHEKVEQNKLSLLKKLDEKEVLDLKGLMKEKEGIEYVRCRLNNVREEIHEISSESRCKLRRLNNAKRICTELMEQQDQQETELKKKCVDLMYKKVPNDATCGVFTLCSLVGGVVIQKDQVVHAFDERLENGHISLVCIDPKDTSKEYWRYVVATDDHLSPVVMSCRDMYCKGSEHFVLAVGKTVFDVLLLKTGSTYGSVESVSPLIIDDFDEGSWITSITACDKPQKDDDEFVISVNNSSLLREYHVSGEALRKMDTKDYASSIIGVAYTENIFAVINRGRDNVILITADSTVKQSGCLRPPPSSSDITFPTCVIWTGADWLVLFVSDGKEKEWKVVNYRKRGHLIGVCCEGISRSEMDLPVSIARYKNTGFVSFADNNIKIFEH